MYYIFIHIVYLYKMGLCIDLVDKYQIYLHVYSIHLLCFTNTLQISLPINIILLRAIIIACTYCDITTINGVCINAITWTTHSKALKFIIKHTFRYYKRVLVENYKFNSNLTFRQRQNSVENKKKATTTRITTIHLTQHKSALM